MKTLNEGELEREYYLAGFCPGARHEGQLLNLGLLPNAALRLVARVSNQQLIVQVNQNRLALTQEVATEILIKETRGQAEHHYVPLSELAKGEKAVVQRVIGENLIKRRLMDMGLTGGTPLLLVKKAPLGDPLEIRVRGYELSLRKAEAELIYVERGQEHD